MIQFNEEQITELETIFGLTRKADLLKVSDGYVTLRDKVWWHSEAGPKHQEVIFHSGNIKSYPQFYSIKEPKTKVTYL